jgi:hypothetical protein
MGLEFGPGPGTIAPLRKLTTTISRFPRMAGFENHKRQLTMDSLLEEITKMVLTWGGGRDTWELKK